MTPPSRSVGARIWPGLALVTARSPSDLFISAKTADRDIPNIYTKIGTSSRATAIRWTLDTAGWRARPHRPGTGELDRL